MWWNATTPTSQITTEDVNSGPTLWPALARRDEALVSVEIGVQMAIFLLAVGGNGLVLGMLVAMSRRKDLGRMYTMIGHLSCADLLVAIFNLLPQVVRTVVYYSVDNNSRLDSTSIGPLYVDRHAFQIMSLHHLACTKPAVISDKQHCVCISKTLITTTIKLETSPAILAQVLPPSLA